MVFWQVDKFTYLGSSVSSTETDINTRLAKAWTPIDRLSVIWKSDLTDKIAVFSKLQSCRYCYIDAPHRHWLNVRRKSLTAITQDCFLSYRTSPEGNTSQNSSSTATNHPSRKLSNLDGPDMRDTAGEVRTNSLAMYSRGLVHMDEERLEDQLEPIRNSSVPKQDVALKTSRER